jgi:hypothetical protein
VAWHLDLTRGELTGNPITVAEVAGSSVNNAAGISFKPHVMAGS